MDPKRDVVLFLGAGFSRDAGLPTMIGFGPESRDELKVLAQGSNKRNVTKLLLKAGQVFSQFQDYCGQNKITKLNVDNMEEIFCVAEALKECGIKTISLKDGNYRTDDLITQIHFWLWKFYQQCPPLNQQRIAKVKPEAYKQLMTFISGNNLSSRLAVITTNYDLIFEYYAWDGGLKCSYPFKKDAIESLYAGERKEVYITPYQEAKNLLICKLHGSINYFKTQNSKLGVCVDVAYCGDRIGESGVPSPNRPAIFTLDSIWSLHNKYNGSEPVIIPPTYAKLQKDEWLRDTWNTAFNFMSGAKTIVFLGYSLPETDGFIRAMLQAAFSLRTDKNLPQIHIVNPDKGTFIRYKKVFPDLETKNNFENLGFSEAMLKGKLKDVITRNL